MPLEFQSKSHGSIAFGFFNIETDMLLLDRYFFFCTEFCTNLSEMAAIPGKSRTGNLSKGYHIADPAKIGDLMGAISGNLYTGFIGALYRRFPFPHKQENFKQNPEGYGTRETVKTLVEEYGSPLEIKWTADIQSTEISIGSYRFTKNQFHELIKYVWRGGYPRWKDDQRPAYVLEMKETISHSESPLFAGLFLSS